MTTRPSMNCINCGFGLVLLIAGCARSEVSLEGSRPADEAQPMLTRAVQLSAEAGANALPTPRQGDADEKVPVDGDIDLASCLKMAWAENRSQQRSRLALERAQLNKTIARRQVFNPQFNADYTIREGADSGQVRADADVRLYGFDIEPFVEVDGFGFGEDDDPTYTSTVGIVFSRSLLRLSETIRQQLPLTRANQAIYESGYEYVRSRREMSYQVTEAYYNILRAQRRLAIRQRRVDDAKQFLRDVEKLVPKTAAPIEATNARIDLNRGKADLVRDQTRLAQARERLAELLGRSLADTVTPKDVPIESVQPTAFNFEQDLAFVKTQHERVKVQELRLEILQHEIAIDADRRLPELEARLTVQQEYEGDAPFDDSIDEDGQVLLGFSLAMPLDGFAAERAQYARRQLALRDAKLQLTDVRTDLERQMRQQYRRLHEIQLTMQLAEELFSAESEKLASSLQRYKDGNLDNLEVTRAKQAHESAELNLLEARIDLVLAEARYRSFLPVPEEPTDP